MDKDAPGDATPREDRGGRAGVGPASASIAAVGF